MSDQEAIRLALPGPNDWEEKVLSIAAHKGVLAACREAYADGMNWEQKEQWENRCTNCGKPMAAHGHRTECYPRQRRGER